MGRILTNNTSLSYSIETALGIAGTAWSLLEPNEISAFGTEITTVARDPISKNRQRRKGTVVDLDSMVEFDHDLTLSAFDDFVEGFLFATAANGNLEFVGPPATITGYTVPALSANAAGKLQFATGGLRSLVFARGYVQPANNGLKALGADPLTSGTLLTVAGLVAETPPTNAVVEIAGIRAQTGDLALAIASGVGTLSSGNNSSTSSIDFTTLGLVVGQFIHIGGLTLANQFTEGYGFARIKAITGPALTLDKLGPNLVASGGAAMTVDLLFGQFIRNVPVDNADFIERSFQFELESPNLMAGGASGFEYAKGNLCDSMQVELPLSNKATIAFGFMGTDTEVPTITRKAGASTALDPSKTGAFNTSADILRLRVTDVDEAGLTTDFKSVTITFNNNVSPEKVLGQLGAKYMNTGNFEVDIEAQILFTNADVIARIRENTTVSMDFAVRNDDGAIYFDIPSMTLGGGDRELPRNESVMLNLTGEAFGDPILKTSLSVSRFPIVPSA